MDEAPTGRHETRAEQQDRKWEDLLQELRVMQTGAQLTAGFLLTLPFQDVFWERLGRGQEVFYLVLVVLAGLTTALVMTPVAIHRRLVGGHVKDRLVAAAHRLMSGVLACLALLVVGITTFIFDVVVSLAAALVAGGVMGAVMVGLLLVVPALLARD
ncbi:DUF6328 family protein [Nocardioides sp. W7]|uniref:DUF6328 family protein n=1 Tax=Nocardioides sp. W7 TaxID=2931390 RepID=UPI001FD12A9D|nr:DUF6328 family protein [Nocardioides sp. W7]